MIIRCFNNVEEQDTNGSGVMAVGIRCVVRCARGQATSYRQCDVGGYWTGERLKCHLPQTGTETALYENHKRVKRCECLFGCGGGGGGSSGGGKDTTTTTTTTTPYPRPRPPPRDTTPPDIKCHRPQTPITATIGECDAVVTWSPASASDSKGLKSVVQIEPKESSGSRFPVGNHAVIYRATDNNNLKSTCSFSFTVRVVQCLPPHSVSHGTVDCDYNQRCKKSYMYGSKCTVTCQSGYSLSEKKCPPPVLPANVDKLDCSNDHSSGSSCVSQCKLNFTLPQNGINFINCMEDETWSGTLTGCEDSEPPELGDCPGSLTLYADRDNDTAVGTWPVPVVTDNVDTDITPVLSEGIPPLGSRFKVGEHEIEYSARDKAGNEASKCRFTIIVQETFCRPPMNSERLMISCPLMLSYGKTCNLSCENGYALNGADSATCERNDSSPAQGFLDNTGQFCEVKDCSKLKAPKNGALTYDRWLNGMTAIQMCNIQYDIPRGATAADQYVCDTTTGTWLPNNKVPDCTGRHNPNRVRLQSELRYFSGDCTSAATQTLIKQRFIDALNTSAYRSLCQDYDDCGIDNVVVECGSETRRKRRHTSAAVHRTIRIKRDYTHEVQVTFDFFLELRDEPDVSAQDKWTRIESTLDDMGNYMKNDIADGGLSLEIDNFPMQIEPDTFKRDYAELQCPPGSLARDDTFTCAVCPTGTFFDSVSDDCVDCPVGTYQDSENKTSCIVCPNVTSTLTTGAREVDKCIDMCPAGSYSDTGLIPCGRCAAGMYQPHRNMKSCSQCPPVLATVKTGSTSLDDCQPFQLGSVKRGGTMMTSDVVSVNTNSWSVTFWLKLTSSNTNILSITNADVMFQLTQPLALSYGFVGTTDTTDITLADNKWHHIGVVWDGTQCQLRLYHKGAVVATRDMSGHCSAILSPDTTLTFGSSLGDFDGSITMFSVWNSSLSDATIRDLSKSCLYDDTGASFQWHMALHTSSVNMITQIPTTCDAANYCEPDPCHGHKCLDKLDGFVCHCGRGFTGETCDIPPDYCLHNLCLNGASCLSGSASYTCQCAVGFRGRYCQQHIVNGGYGPWSAWSSCTKTCEVGAQSRSRQCNDPVPDLDGLPCVRPSSETQDCNKDKCPGCVEFTNFRGLLHTTVECSQTSNGDTLCHVSCNAGMKPIRAISNPYICGPSTEFVWSHELRNPRARLPSCARSAVPERAVLKVGATYSVNSSDMLQPMETHLTTLMENNPCVQSGDCNVSISVNQVSEGNRVRRDTNNAFQGLLVVTATTLHIDYFPNNTLDVYAEATAMANWAYIVDSLMGVALSIEAAANSGNMSITVDGVTYAPIEGSLLLRGERVCPSPMVTTNIHSLCVNCPPGTYSSGRSCVPCKEGLYQDEEGQVMCKPCPDGWKTSFLEATSAADCTVSTILPPSPPPDDTNADTNGDTNGTKTVIVAVAVTAALVCLVIATVVVVIKCLHRNTVSTNGDVVVTRRTVTPHVVTPRAVTPSNVKFSY